MLGLRYLTYELMKPAHIFVKQPEQSSYAWWKCTALWKGDYSNYRN